MDDGHPLKPCPAQGFTTFDVAALREVVVCFGYGSAKRPRELGKSVFGSETFVSTPKVVVLQGEQTKRDGSHDYALKNMSHIWNNFGKFVFGLVVQFLCDPLPRQKLHWQTNLLVVVDEVGHYILELWQTYFQCHDMIIAQQAPGHNIQ